MKPCNICLYIHVSICLYTHTCRLKHPFVVRLLFCFRDDTVADQASQTSAAYLVMPLYVPLSLSQNLFLSPVHVCVWVCVTMYIYMYYIYIYYIHRYQGGTLSSLNFSAANNPNNHLCSPGSPGMLGLVDERARERERTREREKERNDRDDIKSDSCEREEEGAGQREGEREGEHKVYVMLRQIAMALEHVHRHGVVHHK